MKFHLACAQFRSRLGEVQHNLSQMEKWCEEAARHNAKVIVFPEACLTGYCRPKQMRELAQPFAGELSDRLAAMARQNDLLIAFGMPERDNSTIFNSMLAISPDGDLLSRYRKTHLWAAESKWATPGNELVSFQTDLGKFGLMLCYDARFPEVARSLALDGAEIVLVSSAWRSTHVEEWRLCARARAIDNGIFVAGSDAVLNEEHFQCAGGSIVAGLNGNAMALATYGEEQIIVAEIDTALIAERRRDLPLLEVRRPELYHRVIEAPSGAEIGA